MMLLAFGRVRLAASALALVTVLGATGSSFARAPAQPVPPVGSTADAPARLSATIVDGVTGAPTPVRVRVWKARGAVVAPPESAIGLMFSPRKLGALVDGSFYVDGAFEVELKPGTYKLSLSKGNEYLRQLHELSLEPGAKLSQTFSLERWINMPERGWYSADDHIHLQRSPRENPPLLTLIAAEDIHAGMILQMGDFWQVYYWQQMWGRDGVYQDGNHLLASGQEEPRTQELGHAISLGADSFVRFKDKYYHYDRVFDSVHQRGGIVGYAHKAVQFHGYRGLTLDVLRNRVDFLEILQNGGMDTAHYYHFLDLGFKLTATAGSDYPWAEHVGETRFYTYVEDDFSFENWRGSVEAGHTFVSNGPIVELNVNGAIPGDDLEVTTGSTLNIAARAFGCEEQLPLTKLELVVHGEVLERAMSNEPGQSSNELAAEMTLPVEHGLWIAARAQAGERQVAHTTPVYVGVDGSGFHNPKTARHYLDLSEGYLEELQREISRPNHTLDQHAWRYRVGLEARMAECRRTIARLREQFFPEPRPVPGPDSEKQSQTGP